MGVCIRIVSDHTKTVKELWDISKHIPKDNTLNNLLKELETYENQIGTAPIGGYNKWEKEFNSYAEFKEALKEGPASISNSVFIVNMAKHDIVICHWTKLGYFSEDEQIQGIFNKVIRILAKYFDSTTAIYAADSAYKTELFSCMICDGSSVEDILTYIKKENIRISDTISGIKRPTTGRYYETDACYIKRF